jgi:hypothetical protein
MVIVAVLMFGCAKTPVTAVTSVPSRTRVAGTMMARGDASNEQLGQHCVTRGAEVRRPPGSLDREIRFLVRAKTLSRQKKEAEAWNEVSDQPTGRRWAIQCDEGTRISGDDTAPPPLA